MLKIKMVVLVDLLAITIFGIDAYAATPPGKQVTAAIILQGGNDSNAKWVAPSTSTHKIHVQVPKNAAITNTLYRIYPKGKRAGSTNCLSTDVKFPCYEASIDQSQYAGGWAQLMLNNDPETQWEFVKGKGYVTAVASNLAMTEFLSLSVLARFEDTIRGIGKTYQGGIIFYIDNTGEHGLIAAPADQSAGIQWYNGTYIATGAIATAVGTGQANTTKIIKAQGAGSYAAKLAANLVISSYNDWFLPSVEELSLMYANIGPVAAAPLTNIGKFSASDYWSSSDYNSNNAWHVCFYCNGGTQYIDRSKDHTFPVRAVRAF